MTASAQPTGSQISHADPFRLGFNASRPRMASHGNSSGATLGKTQL